MIEVEDDPGTSESVVPTDFSTHAQYSHLVKSTHPMAMMIRQSRERNT